MSGVETFEIMTGTAIERTARWVSGCLASVMAFSRVDDGY
jgi:hypothetical protein